MSATVEKRQRRMELLAASVRLPSELPAVRGTPIPSGLFDESWAAPGLLAAPGLRSLNHLAAEGHDDVYALTSYALVFTYAASMALDVISGGTFGARKLAVACGFHDGDVALLDKVDGQDFTRTEPGWV
jgi:hypothetical protein